MVTPGLWQREVPCRCDGVTLEDCGRNRCDHESDGDSRRDVHYPPYLGVRRQDVEVRGYDRELRERDGNGIEDVADE